MTNNISPISGVEPFANADDSSTISYFPRALSSDASILMANHQNYSDTFFLAYWLTALNNSDGMCCHWLIRFHLRTSFFIALAPRETCIFRKQMPCL